MCWDPGRIRLLLPCRAHGGGRQPRTHTHKDMQPPGKAWAPARAFSRQESGSAGSCRNIWWVRALLSEAHGITGNTLHSKSSDYRVVGLGGESQTQIQRHVGRKHSFFKNCESSPWPEGPHHEWQAQGFELRPRRQDLETISYHCALAER